MVLIFKSENCYTETEMKEIKTNQQTQEHLSKIRP